MEADQIAAAIAAADPGVRAVYLFGSLAVGDPSHRGFDIDLAIEGGDVYTAEAVAESASFPVDVVSLERLPATVRKRIRETGRRLFPRQAPPSA